RKLEEITRRVPAWVAAGGAHASIAPLGQQVDGYVRAHQYREAEAVADRILSMLNAPTGGRDTPAPVRRSTPVAPGTNLPRDHAPGLQAFTDVLDRFAAQQMNVFGFPVDWKDLEATPRVYTLDQSFKPLTLVVPRYPTLEAIVLVIRMIDTNARSMP